MIELLLAAWMQSGAPPRAAAREVGSQVCAGCHRTIYQSYVTTGMARSSGRVGQDPLRESFAAAGFEDKPLGVRYRVSEADGAYRLEFERAAAGVRGERRLRWFVGSGNVGRSYLFMQEGFLFQAPVSYFPAGGAWALSPGYAGKPVMDIARPVELVCLNCHASRTQPVAGTENRYREPPFAEGGVSCERCHGPGSRHVEERGAGRPMQAGEIVNPAKLPPARRDSVCEQCHLTGASRVPRGALGVAGYRPGELLADSMSVYVWSGGEGGERAATDHAEQLARSGCRNGAGERLACISCHDPHVQPGASVRVAYFRERCQSCHERQGCSETVERREARGNDCAACHMPKARSREGEHVAFTDHEIPRRPIARTAGVTNAKRELKPFWPGSGSERDLAVAYAGLGMEHAEFRAKALAMLEKLAPKLPGDAELLAQLAQYSDAMGQTKRAQELYERVLRIDPGHVAAGANLGIYRARDGRVAEAMALWERIVAGHPGTTNAAVNLAVAQYGAGRKAEAEITLRRVLMFHPGHEPARRLLMAISRQ